MNGIAILLGPVGLSILGVLVLGGLVSLLASGGKRGKQAAPGGLDLGFGETENMGKASRPTDYPDFPTLLDRFVLPLSQAHPNWERLDGAHDVPGQPVSWFTWNDVRYSVSGETHVRALLQARDWTKEHPGEDPLVVKPTKGGAGRLTLRPEIGWRDEKGIRIETG
ncbi:hypothetical protein D9599_04705 [Roseomonas sp. KE2513]|uniref:hypothetical protein n=1 Tax=Roseomonas sp. KE2513 TaxID=2479202 RepID=UPI0018DFDF3A|nr:hypothetical protein [Roseomonas sp. KE2513]MBI0534871.1 hypothetical protein [Roseomonas sp. KE2513]